MKYYRSSQLFNGISWLLVQKWEIVNVGRFGIEAWTLILPIVNKSQRAGFYLLLLMLLYIQPELMWSFSIPALVIVASRLF